MSNILIYCTNGSGWVSVDGKRETMTKDQFCLIPASTPHTYAADRGDPWTIYWVHYSGAHSGRIMVDDHFGTITPGIHSGETHSDKVVAGNQPERTPGRDSTGRIAMGTPAGSTITKSNKKNLSGNGVVRQSYLDTPGKEARIRLFDEIYQSLASEYAEKNLEYASMVLHHFLGSFTHEQQFAGAGEPRREDLTTRAIAYMKQHISKKIRLQEIASHCDTSVSHFCLRFKNSTSHTPVEYLNNLRIQQACQLLDLTTQKISEISEQLGFSDPFYFSRVFKKSIGQSPKEYRKQKSG